MKNRVNSERARLAFRSNNQAEQYCKILLRAIKKASRGPEDTPIGMESIRNSIYRAFGFRNFCDYQRNFRPEPRIELWFHSKEQLQAVFSCALGRAVEIACERGFTLQSSIDELLTAAVDEALEANERSLRRLIG